MYGVPRELRLPAADPVVAVARQLSTSSAAAASGGRWPGADSPAQSDHDAPDLLQGGASPRRGVRASSLFLVPVARHRRSAAAPAAAHRSASAREAAVSGRTPGRGARHARIPSERVAARRGCAAALRPDAVVGGALRRGAPRAATGARPDAGLHRRARRADERGVVGRPDTSARDVPPTAILSRKIRATSSARHVRDRLDAASRPWWAGVSYSNDSFSDGRGRLARGRSCRVTRLDAAGLRHRPRQRGPALRPRRSA